MQVCPLLSSKVKQKLNKTSTCVYCFQDFMTVEQTYFPPGGSNSTPAHHYTDFKYKTYAPIAFRYFRDLFGIQPDDFLVS